MQSRVADQLIDRWWGCWGVCAVVTIYVWQGRYRGTLRTLYSNKISTKTSHPSKRSEQLRHKMYLSGSFWSIKYSTVQRAEYMMSFTGCVHPPPPPPPPSPPFRSRALNPRNPREKSVNLKPCPGKDNVCVCTVCTLTNSPFDLMTDGTWQVGRYWQADIGR